MTTFGFQNLYEFELQAISYMKVANEKIFVNNFQTWSNIVLRCEPDDK